MNAIYHLTFEQDTGIFMPLGLSGYLHLHALSRVTTYSQRGQGSWKSYPTQTNAQLFTSLWSIVFGSNIEDRWRPKGTV